MQHIRLFSLNLPVSAKQLISYRDNPAGEDPFVAFTEWATDADEEAYENL